MPKTHPIHTVVLTAALALPIIGLTGCVGTSNALLVSSTNVGIDIDSKPPQAEISISRKELAVQPGFEGGQTLPAVMSFSTSTNASLLAKLFTGMTTTFSTGPAAAALTGDDLAQDDDEAIQGVSVTQRPVAHTLSDELGAKRRQVLGPGEMRPLVFGTKTIFGLHTTWDPSTMAPADLKIGMNRKEVAWAPVGWNEQKKRVQIPSTLATLDNHSLSEKGGGTFGHTQYFATGRAATNLAQHPTIRNLLIQRIEPAAASAGTFSIPVARDLVAITNLSKTNKAEVNAASQAATGKDWRTIKTRGTPEQVSAVAAELRSRGLLKG